jgi:hypothetical protein
MHRTLSTRVTRRQFLDELALRGYARSARWHESWIDIGLLDRGDRTAVAGEYTWPVSQVELAAVLLEKNEQVSRGALPKLVVSMWLWWGEEYVQFRQIPRAMTTWARAEAEAPVKRVRKSAAELADRLAHKRGFGKRRLVRAFTDFPASGDPQTLRDPLDDVFDPDRTGQERGPAGAAVTTDRYLALIASRQRAIANLKHYSRAQYERARRFYVKSRTDYAREQPEFAKDPDLGKMHPPVDLNDLADEACLNLLDCLAVLYERKGAVRRQRP